MFLLFLILDKFTYLEDKPDQPGHKSLTHLNFLKILQLN